MRDASGTAVIGYDGSEEAAAAIQHAGSLLGARPAVVVHVWDSLAGLLLHTDVNGLTGPMREAAEEVDLEDRQNSERIAEEGADLAREAGFDAQARPLQGKPKAWHVLMAAADAVDAAVLVIGSRGQGSVKSALFGSVSSGLLHHANRPVLVVPPCDDVSPAGPVLVGYDGSEAANAAIGAAGRLLAPREVVIETVWIPYTGVAAGGVVGAPVAVASRATQELDSIAGTRSEQTAREGARIAADAGLEARAEATQTTGPVWSTIRDSAEVHGAPAIVVGSRGRGSMSSAVLGSTSAALVHHVRLPMLVVPPSTNSGS